MRLIRKGDTLCLRVNSTPSKLFGNCYFALIYLLDDHFDIEYYRENNSDKPVCIDVKYWVGDLKQAVKISNQSLNYLRGY